MNPSGLCLSSLFALGTLLVLGCAGEVDGPAPAAPTEPEEPLTSPAFACNEQLETWIRLSGEGFSPLVVDAIARDGEPRVLFPGVQLRLATDLDGVSATAEPLDLESLDGEPGGDIRWQSQDALDLRIRPDHGLAPGVYDLQVSNPNGNTVLLPAALGIVPRPEVTGVRPDLVCVAQGDRSVAIQGTGFLTDGSQLPAVRIGEEVYAPTAAEDCQALPAVFGAWQRCQTLRVTLPEGSHEPGAWEVEVDNPAPGACSSLHAEDGVHLVVVPPPSVISVSPLPLCGEQLDYEVRVQGEGFVVVDGEDGEIFPTAFLGEQAFTPMRMEGCTPIEHAVQPSAQRCTDAFISVDAGILAAFVAQDDPFGTARVSIRNPDPAGCTSTDEVDLTVVPPPEVFEVNSPMCTAQFDNELVVSGRFFLRIGDTLPEVLVGETRYAVATLEDCTEVPDLPEQTSSCRTARLTIPEGDLATPGDLDVVLTNPEPAACASEESVQLTIVPPPTVLEVSPQPVCTAEEDQVLSIAGTDFLVINEAPPTVTVGGQPQTVLAVEGCEPVAIHAEVASVERCNRIEISVPQGTFVEGPEAVTVTNPEPADCSSTEELDAWFVPPPVLGTIAPDFACLDNGGQRFTLTGTGFLRIEDDLPMIFVDDSPIDPVDADGCLALNVAGVATETCTSLSFDLAEGEFPTGLRSVSVTNPLPAACSSEQNLPLFIAGPPVLTSVEPGAFCSGTNFDGDVTLRGSAFLRIDGAEPTVRINGQEVVAEALEDCETLVTTTLDGVENCSTLRLVVPMDLRGSDLEIEVTNPGPTACGTAFASIVAEPSPVVTTVTPLRVCSAGGSLQIDGANFRDGLEVTLGDLTADEVEVSPDGTRATATFNGPIPTGLHTLGVRNPSGCEGGFETPVRSVPGPLAFYADPEVTWNGMNTQATVYVAGLFGGTVTAVFLQDEAGEELELEFSFDVDRPNTIQALIPAGTLPEETSSASYRFRVVDDVACSNRNNEPLLTIVDDLTIAVDEVLPPFGHTGASTSVVITAVDPLTDDTQTQFVATPRVYLNPLGEDSLARELRSVRYIDAAELGGIIPEGLAVGEYQVIVINPDGTVGLAPENFRVTAEPPPLVDAVSPGAWGTGTTVTAQVTGNHFRDPAVSVTCFGAGVTSPDSIVVTASTSETIDITVQTGSVENLSACILRVTNGDDETWGEYAPIAITNPNPNAGNFLRFNTASLLNVARRGLTSSTGAPAREARYLYAIGGDEGALDSPLASGEFAALDRLGEPQQWRMLPTSLPEPRSMARTARVDDFVYLTGGHDGTGATNSVWRAHVLNPIEVPRITNVELDIPETAEPGEGLQPGVYYYRVSAVFSSADPANPNGESLASDPQAVRIPNLPGTVLTLAWTAPPAPGAQILHYHVYRSLSPDVPFGDESLIATVEPDGPLLTFIDDGSLNPDEDVQPLPLGALGQWHPVASLNTARHGHGMTAVRDTDNPTRVHLFVAGGRDADGTLLASVERLTLEIAGPREQTVPPAATTESLAFGTARADFVLLAAVPDNASRLPGPYLLAMQGGAVNQISVTSLGSGGVPEAWSNLPINQTPPGENRVGYAAAISNNQIFLAGGGERARKNSILCGTNCPSLNNTWTAAAGSEATDRIHGGFAISRGFFYTLGGNVNGTPSRTTEFSILGGTP